MKLATLEFQWTSFIYYRFYIINNETNEILYENELIYPFFTDIVDALIALIHKANELDADVDLVYDELSSIIHSIAEESNIKSTLSRVQDKDSNIFNYPSPQIFILGENNV